MLHGMNAITDGIHCPPDEIHPMLHGMNAITDGMNAIRGQFSA
jgi:hypothetical protein